jgi:hypothetical protein
MDESLSHLPDHGLNKILNPLINFASLKEHNENAKNYTLYIISMCPWAFIHMNSTATELVLEFTVFLCFLEQTQVKYGIT